MGRANFFPLRRTATATTAATMMTAHSLVPAYVCACAAAIRSALEGFNVAALKGAIARSGKGKVMENPPKTEPTTREIIPTF